MTDEYAARRRRFNALKAGFAALRREGEAAAPGRGPIEPKAINVAAIEVALPTLIADLIEEPLMTGKEPGAVLVPGTPFTEKGVLRLLAELEERATARGFSGRAIVANWLIRRLTAPPPQGISMVAGANLAFLQRLAILLDGARAADSELRLPISPSGREQEAGNCP